jgi:glycosyltransferase involved in cell wall biosynthesis
VTPSPLRVRTLSAPPRRFAIDFGQRNAVFVARPLTPQRRLVSWLEALAVLPGRSYDLIHSWNAIPVAASRPFLVTFESFLPRIPDNLDYGRLAGVAHRLEVALRERLTSDGCIALLALTEYAARQFRAQNRGWPGMSSVERKLRVVLPAIDGRRRDPKPASGRLRLLFAAHRFMGKGGPALVRAHERLVRDGVPVETTVVSSLRWSPGDYVGPTSEELVREETGRLRRSSIRLRAAVDNREMLRLLEEADYLVHPTLADTFGYVAMEALAGGTPVLASDTCALPEIVEDGRCGWLLPLDKDDDVGRWPALYRRWESGYDDAYRAAIEQLTEGIVDRVRFAWEQRNDYEALSGGALNQVATHFGRVRARDAVEPLYELCR